VVAALDRTSEGAQPVGTIELVLRHFAIVVCVRELSMHLRVKPKVVRKQLRVQLLRMCDYVVDVISGVVNGCHVTFLQTKDDGRTKPSAASRDALTI
jgi:hypothetical protein